MEYWQRFEAEYEQIRKRRAWLESVTFWRFRDFWSGRWYDEQTPSRRQADLIAGRLYWRRRNPVRYVCCLRVVT